MASPTLQPRVPLAPLTTLGVGGPCDQMAEVPSSDLPSVLEQARQQEQAVLLLGGGSNLLVADAGFRGLVMRLGDKTRSVSSVGDRVQVRVGAGVVWDDLVAWATEQGLGGIECLSGIPGLVGAAPMQNIGAYGQEVGESLVSVDAVDIQTGEGRRFSTAECELGYRTSRFKHRERGQWAVTSVTLALARGGAPALRYAELARRAAEDLGPSPSVQGVRELVLSIRASKSTHMGLGERVTVVEESQEWEQIIHPCRPPLSLDVRTHYEAQTTQMQGTQFLSGFINVGVVVA